MPLPLEIVALRRPTVEITWEDEHRTEYAARDVRLRCRCASCIEEMTGRPLLDPKTVPEDVVATAIDLVGQYAIRITWSDGHDTGIYNWQELRASCDCRECAAVRAGAR